MAAPYGGRQQSYAHPDESAYYGGEHERPDTIGESSNGMKLACESRPRRMRRRPCVVAAAVDPLRMPPAPLHGHRLTASCPTRLSPVSPPGAYYGDGADDGGEVRLRDRHASFRTGANARLQRGSSGANGGQPRSPTGLAGLAAAGALGAAGDDAAMARKFRRRWDESAGGGGGSARDREEDVRGGGADGGPPQARGAANTGHIVRMRRSEAWGKFLAYEGSCQVCMVEGAKGNPDAAYFLSSGCAPLRTGLNIAGLLLPAVLPAHLAASEGASIDLGNEIVWDDCDTDKRLSAAAFVNRMSVIKVGVAVGAVGDEVASMGRAAAGYSKAALSKEKSNPPMHAHLTPPLP
jgi:hypothetical protein